MYNTFLLQIFSTKGSTMCISKLSSIMQYCPGPLGDIAKGANEFKKEVVNTESAANPIDSKKDAYEQIFKACIRTAVAAIVIFAMYQSPTTLIAAAVIAGSSLISLPVSLIAVGSCLFFKGLIVATTASTLFVGFHGIVVRAGAGMIWSASGLAVLNFYKIKEFGYLEDKLKTYIDTHIPQVTSIVGSVFDIPKRS